MMKTINKATIVVELVDTETGEVTNEEKDITSLLSGVSISKEKKTTSSKATKVKDDGNPNPALKLEDNKYILNNAAIEALGVEEGDKIDIKYEVKNKKKTPVIGSADSFGTKGGNKLTKSHTVSYRGKNNEELSKYGDEFTFKDRDKVPGTFYLIGNTVEETIANEEESADNDIDLASEIDNIEDEIDNPDSNEVLPDDLNFNID